MVCLLVFTVVWRDVIFPREYVGKHKCTHVWLNYLPLLFHLVRLFVFFRCSCLLVFQCVCLPVCWSFSVSACLFVFQCVLSACLLVFQYVCPVCLSFSMSACLFVFQCVCLSVCLSVCLPVLFVFQSVCLSVSFLFSSVSASVCQSFGFCFKNFKKKKKICLPFFRSFFFLSPFLRSPFPITFSQPPQSPVVSSPFTPFPTT